MFRALLFDCNGVIADDEPIHFQLFQKVLKQEGISLTRCEYIERYLAMDDKTCFLQALNRAGLPSSKSKIQELIRRKGKYYQQIIKKKLKIFPGVKSFVRKNFGRYTLAVVSGAPRSEINFILKQIRLDYAFSVIVSSEDVKRCKPAPDCYRVALKLLNRLPQFKKKSLRAGECLAIEDSIHGVEAAQKAGMRCLAVTNSYSVEELKKADFVVKSLHGLDWEQRL